MSASDKSDGSFGWNDTGEDTMSSSEEGNVSTTSSVLDRKSHKKKLRKELRMDTSDVEQNGLECSNDRDVEISAKKRKKKKVKPENDSTLSIHVDNELPQVKSEPEDRSRPKKGKIKIEPDESFSCKKSEITAMNRQGNREADITDVKEENSESSAKKKNKKKRKRYSTDQQDIEINDNDIDTPVKKRRKNISIDDNGTVSKLMNGHTPDDPPIENSIKSKKRISFSTNSTEIKQIGETNDSMSKVSLKVSTSSVASANNDSEPASEIKPLTSAKGVKRQMDSRKSVPLTNKGSSFSERIQFEEELPILDDSDKESSHHGKKTSKKIDKFMSCNPHLKNFKLNKADMHITKDDEVWILKCPKDLNHTSLVDSKICLDDKTKLKVDGQTYEGHMQKTSSRIAVFFAASTNACEIRDIQPKGILMLRKRIPKVPINENSIVIPNETFIPLPETKPRHPLFGSDYRKMIKIPSVVTKRLTDNRPKKLSSKQKQEVISMVDEAKEDPEDVAMDVVDGSIKKKKKKKKRKFSETANDDVHVKKERKKFKYDPEVWNSEKAIEQNLFDF